MAKIEMTDEEKAQVEAISKMPTFKRQDPRTQLEIMHLHRILGSEAWRINTAWKSKEQQLLPRQPGVYRNQFQEVEVTKDLDMHEKERLAGNAAAILINRLKQKPDVEPVLKYILSLREEPNPQTQSK